MKAEKFYCKESNCSNEICYCTWKYGRGRCKSCAGKQKRGKTAGGYKDGRSLKIYYCIEPNCNNEICYVNWLCGNRRCVFCSKKGKNAPCYIDGRSLKIYYCKDCGKKIYWQTVVEGKGRCSKCATTGINSHNFGKPIKPYWGIYEGINMRSSWEIWFAQFLDLSGYRWEYEPKTFDLGSTTYTPDFYIPEWNQFIEIKGYFSQKAKDKIDLFKEQYPKENLRIFQRENLKRIGIII